MIYLILSIISSSLIFLIFRAFGQYKVNTFTAIVVNYFIAGLTGLLINGESLDLDKMLSSDWSMNGLILGVVFISLFNIMAITAQKFGASVASIANKMALIIPVSFAIIVYGDSLNILKGIGILLALIGVYLATVKPSQEKKKFDIKLFSIPIILFLGSGFIDTFLKFTQEYQLSTEEDSRLFTSLTFLTAFTIGLIVMQIDKSKRSLKTPSIIGGIILGVVNYGSIYFLIKTLDAANMQSSVIFPINNMGVVILTTFLSLLLFKESFSIKNKIGVALSIIAIAMISFA